MTDNVMVPFTDPCLVASVVRSEKGTVRSEVDLHVAAVYTPALIVQTEGVLTISANCFLVHILNLLIISGAVVYIQIAGVRAERDSIVIA